MKLPLSLTVEGNPVEVGGETHEITHEQAGKLIGFAEHLASRWPTSSAADAERSVLVVGEKTIEIVLGKGLAQRIYDAVEDVAWGYSAGHL